MQKAIRQSANIYWLCQILGWLGMVFIEMVNYTFFIVKRFDSGILYVFLVCALVGLLLTHGYRRIARRLHIFSASLSYIWMHAFVATLIISFIMTIVTEIPVIMLSKDGWNGLSFIGIAGSTINWMRYVGVWIIIYFLYKILALNTAILKEKWELENLAKTTELELLKSQLNPHFLFNALNAIKALVILNPEESREAIVKLSELLRYTLNYGKNPFVNFEDELNEIQKYLHLEKLRFEDRLDVLYRVEDAALRRPFPPALLLTVVENAVKHGIAPSVGKGKIIIEARVLGQTFEVSVSNSGFYAPKDNGGIGLVQVRKRLSALYDDKASFAIDNQDGMVVSKIIIPAT